MRATYLLPIKSADLAGLDELTRYLRSLRDVELLIVDGSEPAVFDAHARSWTFARHVKPAGGIRALNGKARGVITGLALASCEKVIVADDDVRYDDRSLDLVIGALDRWDVVRPQNYFSPAVWHTLLDDGRSLLNRVTGGDFPGTLGVRRSYLPDGYDGDVLFENYQMIETAKAHGARELIAYGIFVARRPPASGRFVSQRVRQAYDEFARPVRLVAALAIAPLLAVLIAKRRWRPIALGGALLAAAAEVGRRRAGAARYFHPAAALAAPLWALERGTCAWLALASRLLLGGIPYAGVTLVKAASR